MPTETRIAWLLLAHQDDEFAAQAWIQEALAEGLRLKCCFFTRGIDARINERRNQESVTVLQKLGVQQEDICFVGEELDIPDGRLHEQLKSVAHWLRHRFISDDPQRLAIPAWEGGHPDHDALHAVTVCIADEFHLIDRIEQFPLYNAWKCDRPWFRVMSPLPLNGAIRKTTIRWQDRWRYLLNCLSYPSQTVSWLGLFPFVAWHLMVRGCEQYQGVSIARLDERPHAGALYYEHRGFACWDELHSRLNDWRKAP